MSEFKSTDKAVQSIASVFERHGWQWAVRDRLIVEPYVPSADDVAASLNHLLKTAIAMSSRNSGNCSSGRLFVEWIDEGYGREVSFGIEWRLGDDD